ncbi:MAG: glycogen synthase GlgA [Rhodospirillaceae bacterium]
MTSVLYVASEAFPLAKTGGLGDVAGALPAALTKLGVDARIMLPAYDGVVRRLANAGADIKPGPALQNVLGRFPVQLLRSEMPGTGVPLWLVDCPPLYARDAHPYAGPDGKEWNDNDVRFALLARVASIVSTHRDVNDWRPDIVHANDWHTGLLPYYLKQAGASARSVFTVHNMAYQGLYDPAVMDRVGIDPAEFTPQGVEFWGKVSFLKAGLIYADRVSTVSPTYAQEIREPGEGKGLEGVLRMRGKHLAGILNGIDESVWNPMTDPHLVQPYDPANIALKADNKAALRASLDLPAVDTAPIVAIVSRLVEQKGIDILLALLPAYLNTGAQIVVLGSGDKHLESRLIAAAAAHPDQVAVRLGYDETFAHRVIAGADILFVPSRYEPCGLTQLYAQRYGTIPVVHRVGGLADTVTDEDDGFTFDALTPAAAVAALVRAGAYYRKRPRWRAMQRRAMHKHFGWDICARRTLDLYHDVLNDRPTATEGTYGTALTASR